MLDKIKLSLAILIIVGGISGFYLLADMPPVVRAGAFLGSLIVAALVAWMSTPGKTFIEFARESVKETRKVVWPTGKETVRMTGVVIAFVFVMAIFLWGIDAILASLIQLLMGTEA